MNMFISTPGGRSVRAAAFAAPAAGSRAAWRGEFAFGDWASNFAPFAGGGAGGALLPTRGRTSCILIKCSALATFTAGTPGGVYGALLAGLYVAPVAVLAGVLLVCTAGRRDREEADGISRRGRRGKA